MNPKRMSAQRLPKRYGIHEVKSYFVWHAKIVSATNMPAVRIRASRTILFSENVTITDIEYASNAVKPLRKRRLVGYDFRFQNVKSMNPIAPKSETHIIHGFDRIHVLYNGLM